MSWFCSFSSILVYISSCCICFQTCSLKKCSQIQ
jgi:hypothetical protein